MATIAVLGGHRGGRDATDPLDKSQLEDLGYRRRKAISLRRRDASPRYGGGAPNNGGTYNSKGFILAAHHSERIVGGREGGSRLAYALFGHLENPARRFTTLFLINQVDVDQH